MSHEIEEHDWVVLHKNRAWHNLGTVIEESLTPREALPIAKMDWTVEQWPLTALGPDGSIELEDFVLNIRADIKHPFGVVTSGYQPIQNHELADFCQSLAEEGDVVKIESAGSIRNGAKVWFLLKGESFSVREDEITPYICVSNGHDGMASLRCTPTTIRVVCSNTLHMVIPRTEGARGPSITPAGFSIRHVGDVMGRVEEAKQALKLYGKGLEDTKTVLDSTAAKEIHSREDVQKFFLECYTADWGAVPSNPQNAREEKARWRAMEAFNQVASRFDAESKLVGANYWAAVNAYSGWVQNDKKPRIKDPFAAEEQKVHSKLFGQDASRAFHALQVALSA